MIKFFEKCFFKRRVNWIIVKVGFACPPVGKTELPHT